MTTAAATAAMVPVLPGMLPEGASSEVGFGSVPGLFGALVNEVQDGVPMVVEAGLGEGQVAGEIETSGEQVVSGGEAWLAPALDSVVTPVVAEGQVTVQGNAVAVAQIVMQIQTLYAQLVESGVLTVGQLAKGSDLAAALVQQGMEPAQAAEYASKVETMLALLKAQGVDLGEETAGELAMVLLAGLMQGEENLPQSFQVSGEQAAVLVQVQVAQAEKLFMFQMYSSSQAGLPGLGVPQVAPAAGGQMVPEIKVQVSDMTDERAAQGVVQVMVGEAGGAGRLPGLNETGVWAEKRFSQVAETVDESDVMNTPKGVEIYRWQVAKGQDVVTAQGGALSLQKPVQLDLAGSGMDADVMQEVSVLGRNVVQPDATGRRSAEYAPLADLTNRGGGEGGVMTVGGGVVNGATGGLMNTQAGLSVAGESGVGHGVQADAQMQGELDHAALAVRMELATQARAAQQLKLQILPLAEQGGGQVRMTLNPPELGRIEVQLTVRDGQVQGSVAASDRAVLEHLVRELPSLRQGLAEAGLKVSEQGVSLMLSDSGQQQNNAAFQQSQHEQQARSSRGNGQAGGELRMEDELTQQMPMAVQWVAPERLMDIRI